MTGTPTPNALRLVSDRAEHLITEASSPASWKWIQNAAHCFTLPMDAAFAGKNLGGRALWELDLETTGDVDWATHRQQRDWRADFSGFEVACVDHTGGRRYFSLSGSPFYSEAGDFSGYQGSAIDITRNKLAALLATAAVPVHAVPEMTGDSMYVPPPEAFAFLANRALRAFINSYSPDETSPEGQVEVSPGDPLVRLAERGGGE